MQNGHTLYRCNYLEYLYGQEGGRCSIKVICNKSAFSNQWDGVGKLLREKLQKSRRRVQLLELCERHEKCDGP